MPVETDFRSSRNCSLIENLLVQTVTESSGNKFLKQKFVHATKN